MQRLQELREEKKVHRNSECIRCEIRVSIDRVGNVVTVNPCCAAVGGVAHLLLVNKSVVAGKSG